MSNKKQTAVEWLYKQLNGLNKQILDDYFQIVFSQAKEMEKQQIIHAYNQGCLDTLKDGMKRGDQYYNETYETK
jgi:hypothetical protein